MSGRPLLTVRGLRGGNVHGIDFDVYAGEIVGFAGITGSGREHVLPLLAGQIPRDDGDVVLDGVEIANYRAAAGDRASGSPSCPPSAPCAARSRR